MSSSNTNQSEQELHELMRRMYHDLKSPLNGIATLAEFLEDELQGQLSDEAHEYMVMLKRRTNRAILIINGIRQYYRASEKTKVEIVDVPSFLKKIIDTLSPPPTFSVEITSNITTCTVEKKKLEIVLTHLISNALKFHHHENGKIEVLATESGNFYQFVVTDDGPGIAPQYHKKIFELLETLQPRDEIEGAGAGLAIVEKIVTYRGGMVSIRSAEGEGTSFTFTWPKTQAIGLNLKE